MGDEDQSAWANYLRGVRTLPGRIPVEPPPLPIAPAPSPAVEAEPPPRPRAPRKMATEVAIGAAPAGVDKSSWQRFRSGRMRVARRLDLHAMTADQAFSQLRAFIDEAHAAQLRVVEVITGRGRGPEGGVLKRELPAWLNRPEMREKILAAVHPHASNSGSVLVLLRRIRA